MEKEIMGTKVHYELSGQGEKRVVLLHGWGCSVSLMEAPAKALEKDLQVLRIDFPGHGKSGRPPEPWGVPEYAACTLALLQELDFLPCDVVAHSFGARVAIWLAAEDSSRFGRIVLTGAAGLRKPQTEAQKKRSEEYRKLRSIAEKLGRIGFMKTFAEQMQDELRHKYGSEDYNALDEEMRKTFVKVVNLDLSDKLGAIKSPTLLLWGEKDEATPLWMAQQMERSIPDCALIVLKGGTHYAYLEQSSYFNTVVHHFLTEE